jgi:hypothetical protein
MYIYHVTYEISTPGHAHARPNLLCDLKPHAQFGNPTITPSGRKVTTSEEKKREKTSLIVDQYSNTSPIIKNHKNVDLNNLEF